MLSLTIALLVVALSLLWGYARWRQSYWTSKGVSVPTGYPIIGNAIQMMIGETWVFARNAYKLYSEEKVFGLYEFFKPTLAVCDPNLIKLVLVKDFDHFTDRRKFSISSKGNEWLDEILFALSGEQWKRLRATITPTFSTGKMKHMFSIVHEQINNFVTHCEKKISAEREIDIKKSFNLLTMDVIAASAFGIECNSLLKENPIFVRKAEKMFSNSLLQNLQFMLILFLPKLSAKLGIRIADDTFNFFRKVSRETIDERKKCMGKRGDFLDLLLEEEERQSKCFDETKEYKITDSTILAQSVMFLISGYDTTANLLSITSFFLAKYPEHQEKLRQELEEICNDGEIDYHKIMEANYLDACISETLRLVPPLPMLERRCTKEYSLEGTDLIIPQDMVVVVPVWGIHRDPLYWPEPNEYKPERFLPENRSTIVPFTYMPFGLGPRSCVAMRFALMEAKLCISKLLMNFEISLAHGCDELKLQLGGGVVRSAPGSVVLSLRRLTQ